MAEAEAAGAGADVMRYLCHECNQVVTRTSDYSCSICNSGFIEEYAGDEQEQNAPAENNPQEHNLDELFNFIRNVFLNQPNQQEFQGAALLNNRQRPNDMEAPLDFVNLIVDASNRNSIGARFIPTIDFGFLLHSNLNDYAIGQEGLDAVVTQLLNQFEGTGPPPMPKNDIEQLPDVLITTEQVSTNLQCTVCMDDFILDEGVKQLTCKHVFHKDCIVPWLEMHGTCPICRKLLNNERQEGAEEYGGQGFIMQSERTNLNQQPNSQSSSNPGSSGYRSSTNPTESNQPTAQTQEGSSTDRRNQHESGDHNYNSQRSFDYGFDDLD